MTPRHSFASDEPALAVGDVLARKYRLLEPLGEGNMAVVWVALNVALETRVAVKILRAGLAGDPRLVARFRQEAKATAAIAHKNIVQVYDYGITSSGAPFITMELLEGETLAERLKRGPLPPTEAVHTLLRAMKGVTVAHSKGVVHRDLKPDNIFLAIEDNGTERPKVLDFGVSFVKRSRSDERLTKAGGLLGTPAYLPPEMIEGDSRGDVRGDVWAFGVMLYETMSGRMPFVGRTVHALLDSICHSEPPSLSGLVPAVDPDLQAIVDRTLAKDPDERYPGVRELYDDLEAWLGHQDLSASATRRSPVTRAPLDDDDGPTLVGPSLDSMRSLPAADLDPGSDRAPGGSRDRISSPSRDRISSLSPERTPLPGRGREPGRHSSAPVVTATLHTPPRRHVVALVSGLLAALVVLAATWTRPGPIAPVQLSPLAPSGPLAATGAVSGVAAMGGAAASGAPAVDEATVDVIGLPDHSLVRLDDRRIERLPVAIERGRTVRLRVDAPGYEPWLQEVVIEGSVRLRYNKRPLHAPVRATPPASEYREVPY